ncbi:Protease 3 precursor [Symmachiella macrocystis]|uniref:Protease 3 n=1 Tax=Symmachiella macrocystis TaxID=2527985 RepID=A0A5C6B577_9PLAN|nr:pitrilysin family protein [Symmachiella macrocystis]TWU06712.1 Protease 3 precursor [Symmachiella macrocystis]
MEFHKATLDNGLQIVAEQSPAAHSVAVGFFVRTGSRDETQEVSGVSHFLEHMVFKGTDRFAADDVNRIFDEIGAKYNASTSEEVTLFYGAVLPEYLPRIFDLLAEILRPSLRTDDFDTEKKVILEEIGRYEDEPTFTAYETLMQTHFAGHPLGQCILGTVDSINALTADQMRGYFNQRYLAGNITLAVAGNFDWDEVLALAEKQCKDWPAGDPGRTVTEAQPPGGIEVITNPSSHHQHIMQMTPAPPSSHPDRYAAELLGVIVGDDSGSRMYWDLVDPGYAEMAEMSYNDYDGSGVYLMYCGCAPEQTAENMRRIETIFHEVNDKGVTEEELTQAKNKVSSRIVLRSERPMGRLGALGSNWLYRGEYRSVEDDLNVIAGITSDDIRRLLDEYPLGQTTTTAVGPLESLNGEVS